MNNSLNRRALYWASFNYFELRLSGEEVEACSHPGACDSDVAYYAPKVAARVRRDGFPNKPTPDTIRKELRECGAWDETELADDAANWHRLVWIAAGNIREDDAPDCSKPLPSRTPSGETGPFAVPYFTY